jgi:hypothetical protein
LNLQHEVARQRWQILSHLNSRGVRDRLNCIPFGLREVVTVSQIKFDRGVVPTASSGRQDDCYDRERKAHMTVHFDNRAHRHASVSTTPRRSSRPWRA